jgi:superfamily II DNA or RNA helicase
VEQFVRIEAGQVIEGDLFNEPMRVETVTPDGPDAWTLGLSGRRSERFTRVRLTRDQLARVTIRSATATYDGDGTLLRLGISAYSLGIAYEFDPFFGLSISRVDPLPHQLEAVYDHMLRLPTIRFLLADDAGAGKTIMSGLLLRELKLRGLAERVLIVTPANLTFQWQRELKDRFGEQFVVLRGGELRSQFGVNPWKENKQILTSLDLAKREDVLPGLKQVEWDLVIIDEAHRMSASSEDKKSERYRLGELLRDHAGNILLLTATPHKGDPVNFTLFLQLLDRDAFAHVRSIEEAMKNGVAPFYLRRTKEAMKFFPEQGADGLWRARNLFTKRIPRTASFNIDGDEYALYASVTNFVRRMSHRAAAQAQDDPRARATGFLMALYQRRLASSTYALRQSLERRADLLEKKLSRADDFLKDNPTDIPDADEMEEMEAGEREAMEKKVEAVVLTQNRQFISEEVSQLRQLALQAQDVMNTGEEAKLARLEHLLTDEGFIRNKDQRLLIFTEFKDTLDYLVETLRKWGLTVGFIHGGMKPGSRDEPGTRLFMEQQFREGAVQILVATEAAGEGINLQFCNQMVNYDIPWNPNRLEQRMGRIHRYGQTKDCLIFNFVATNTIEGKVLERLLERLQEIRDALDSDSVFNVVGEVFPAAHIERVFRDYYAGKLGDAEVEDAVLEPATEQKFRQIATNTLEQSLAKRTLNLPMLLERRAIAQERRMVPETIARFLVDTSNLANLSLKPLASMPHTYDPGPTPPELRRFETRAEWRLPSVATRYPRITTDRLVAEKERSLEWVTPGHPLFEALRLHTWEAAQPHFANGAAFFSLEHQAPARLDFYRARVVDGTGRTVHERLFAVEVAENGDARLRDPTALGDLMPAKKPADLPKVATLPEPTDFLNREPLAAFLSEVSMERIAEVDRVAKHVEIALTELISKEDDKIGRFALAKESGVEGAAGFLAQAENRHAELMSRRDLRRAELAKQRHLTLQGVERLTNVLILPHPDRDRPDIRNLRQDKETEEIAMRYVIEHERSQGREVFDVHEKNLGYDITSIDLKSGELRLIEVKGLGASEGNILLTPNEYRIAQDRRDCYWLYVVTGCKQPTQNLKPIKDPASKPWIGVSKVQHYTLSTRELEGGR